MNKNAFSLPEVLMFLVIVGVISTIMLTMIRPNEKYLKYAYHSAYNILETTGFNVFQDAMDARDSEEASSIPDRDKTYPKTPQELCKKFALDPTSAAGSAASKYGYINTSVYNCGSLKTVSKNAPDSEFTEDKVAFKASNSMKFYISPLNSFNVYDWATEVTATIGYYIVWVDLNGDRRPNTTVSKPGRGADIVPFVVTITGKAIPVGKPTVDPKYMLARVQYTGDTNRSYSKTRTFVETQMAAFGNKEYPSVDIFSVRNSLKTALSGTAAEIKASDLPAEKSPDSKCVLVGSQVIPNCVMDVE